MKKTGKKTSGLASTLKDTFALSREKHSKTRRDLVDYDYLDKLNDEERQWLARFSREWVDASFPKDESRLHPIVKGEAPHRYASKEVDDVYRKDSENMNNSRNRCLLTAMNAASQVDLLVDTGGEGQMRQELKILRHSSNVSDTEDALNATIDWLSEFEEFEQ